MKTSDYRLRTSTRQLGRQSAAPGSRLFPVALWSLELLTGACVGLFAGRILFELFPAALFVLAGWVPRMALAFLGTALAGLRLRRNATPVGPFRPVSREWPAFLLLLGLAGYLIQPVATPLAGILLLAVLLVGMLARPLTLRGGLVLARPGEQRHDWLAALGLGTVAALLYWHTLAPGVRPGDSGEFQALATILGIPHPTGYPLYMLAGHALVKLLPFGDPAYRLNLFSAAMATFAVVALFAAARQLYSRPAAALAALFATCSPLLWSEAVQAEKYALHAAFTAVILFLLLRLLAAGRTAAIPTVTKHPSIGVWLLVFTFGLGLAHHRTIVLLAPATLLAIFYAARNPDAPLFRTWQSWWGSVALSLGMLLLPLLLYLYLPWSYRFHQEKPLSRELFLAIVLARTYTSFLHPLAPLTAPLRYLGLGRELLRQFGPFGSGLAVLGVFGLLLRSPERAGFKPAPNSRHAALVLLVVVLANAYFYLVYFVDNVEVYLMPALLCLALLLGAGAQTLAWLVSRGGAWLWKRADLDLPVSLFCIGGSALVLFSQALAILPLVDLHNEVRTRTVAYAPFKHGVPPYAVIVAEVSRNMPLFYAAQVAFRRPDVGVVMPDTEEDALGLIADDLHIGRAVYLARTLPGVPQRYYLSAEGTLTRVYISSPDLPVPTTPPLARFVSGPALLSASLPASGIRGQTIPVDLLWRRDAANGPIVGPAQVHLVLRDATGTVWSDYAPGDPVNGMYPLPLWRDGERVGDHYDLPLPSYLPNGSYEIALRLVPPFTHGALALGNGEKEVLLGHLQVFPGTLSPEERSTLTRVDTPVGSDLLLLGYRAEGALQPDSTLDVLLYWTAIVSPGHASRPATITLTLAGDRDGAIVVDHQHLPALQAGEVLATHTRFALPAQLASRHYRLRMSADSGGVGLPALDLRSGLPEQTFLLPHFAGQALPVLNVPNFGGRIVLADRQVLPHASKRSAHVTLVWQDIQPMATNYTVFVHLLGPGGRVYSQIDSLPVRGTALTTRWQFGERFVDPYDVPTSGLPAGTYQVEVGLYDAATMGRLPLLDNHGQAVSDHLIVGSVEIQ